MRKSVNKKKPPLSGGFFLEVRACFLTQKDTVRLAPERAFPEGWLSAVNGERGKARNKGAVFAFPAEMRLILWLCACNLLSRHKQRQCRLHPRRRAFF